MFARRPGSGRMNRRGIGSDGGSSTPGAVLLTRVIETFDSDGTFTTPATVYSPTSGDAGKVWGMCWGGGAGGTVNAGSGGGAAFSAGEFTPGAAETVTVSTGGSVGADGGDTSIGVAVVAKGGLAAASGSTGGTAAASTGTIKFSGGNGTVGTGTRFGGGGAGDRAAASGSAGGAETGGPQPAGIYGGGGSSFAASASSGGRGVARIIYDVPATPGFPRIVASSFGRSAADGTSLAAHMPCNPDGTAIDFTGLTLVMLVASDSNPTVGESSGDWTALTPVSNSTINTLAAFYIVGASGSETATITTTTSQQVSYWILAIANGGAPEWSTASGLSVNPDPPSLTYSGGSMKGLWVVALGVDSSAYQDVSAFPVDFSNKALVTAASAGGSSLAVCTRLFEDSVLDPGAMTMTANSNFAVGTLVVPPL